MRSFIRFGDCTKDNIFEIFKIANEIHSSDYFVGYDFKKYLIEVQQAIMLYCLTQ